MAENYDVSIKVVSQKGTCEAGHRVDHEWLIKAEESKTPPGICLFAFGSFYPALQVLAYGGVFPWESDSDVVSIACPDSENPVVFKLRRIPA